MRNQSIQINKWIKQLSEIRLENAMYKFTLSELVDKSVMSDFLSKAEKMQSELIENDHSIELLIDSANYLLSKPENNEPGAAPHNAGRKKQLEEDLKTFINRFRQLRIRFKEEMLGKQTEIS